MATTRIAQELTIWVHRGIALFCLGSLVPAAFMAADQLNHQAPWWLWAFGAGIVVLTIVMCLAAVAARGVVWLARLYIVLVLAAILTWPTAWTSPEPSSGSPWLWMCLGVAAVWASQVTATQWGFVYAIVSGAIFAWVRMTPSGQGASLVVAMQDMLVLIINPSAVIIGITLLTDSIRKLNVTMAETQRQQAGAAVERALVEERRRLDSIVHDEVMTTLVNAAMNGRQKDQQVTQLARHAIDQLELAGQTRDDRVPVTAEHLGWLVRDVVTSLLPDAAVTTEVSDLGLTIPPRVASSIGQACREVAMNIARHAEADHVRVAVEDAGERGLRVTVEDDGVGFDTNNMRTGRFGLKLSVMERMQSVGGQVDLRSTPGEGTTVVLTWLAPADAGTQGQQAGITLAPEDYPELPSITGRTLTGLIAVLIGLHFLLGWTNFDQVTAIWPVMLAQLLAVVAAWLALRDLDASPLPLASGVGVLALLTAVTLLVQAVLPVGEWPGYATWHSSVVMVLVIVLLFRGQQELAWTGVVLFVLESIGWAYTHDLGLGEVVRVVFGPVSWVVVAQLANGWLADIGTRVKTTQETAYAANLAIAESYSRLVLRDIWLRQLTTQVGPLLNTIADPDATLTEADLEAALAMERRLRDGLRASNLLTEGTQDVVEAARDRGVDVRLVDSRGSALPESVSKALKLALTTKLNDRSVKKLVARAAPEGYDDVVTILTVRTDGKTELVGLDATGAYTTR